MNRREFLAGLGITLLTPALAARMAIGELRPLARPLQYGDYIQHTSDLPKRVLNELLYTQARATAEALGLAIMPRLEYGYNIHCDMRDPVTGALKPAFISFWKFWA